MWLIFDIINYFFLLRKKEFIFLLKRMINIKNHEIIYQMACNVFTHGWASQIDIVLRAKITSKELYSDGKVPVETE